MAKHQPRVTKIGGNLFLHLRNPAEFTPRNRVDFYAILISQPSFSNRFPTPRGINIRHHRSFRLPTMRKTKRPQTGVPDWRDRKIREWLLLLLRYAVTREAADRFAVLALADELDSVGVWWRPSAPSFFRRTSREVCAAIETAGSAPSAPVLHRHIARIDDPRLRRAFAAALGLNLLAQRRVRKTKPERSDLWKGLSAK